MKQIKKNLQYSKKQAKNVKKAQEKVAKKEAVVTETKSKRNALEEVINTTKTLDDLKTRLSELQRQKEETMQSSKMRMPCPQT